MGHKRTHTKSTLAELADRHWLYQQSVQVPEAEISFFKRAFKRAHNRAPLVLREDFCGTAAVCCHWVRMSAKHRAYGIDIDRETLQWGLTHNVGELDPEARARVRLVQQDVREVKGPKADVIAAQNFSFFTFKTRDELRHYFSSARQNLGAEGILVLDVMGGSQVMKEDRRESRHVDGFRYVWDQYRFDPITHRCQFYIHFKFSDGSKLKRAFSYDWRLWGIPEIRELLAEAGFTRSEVYWEGTDEDSGEGNGIYRRREHAPSDPAWIAYVVGIKQS